MPNYRWPLIGLLASFPSLPAVSAAPDALPSSPLFHRHVVPLFSRLGCNAGACHGAVQGKNGFRLSLFGADPAADHLRLLREFGGRRVDLADPANSLLLKKASSQTAHDGGKLMDAHGPEYQMLLAWMREGAQLDSPEAAGVARLEVEPMQYAGKAGDRFRLKVWATFADGSKEDVSQLSTFESLDLDVARVDRSGLASIDHPGQARLIVRYRGQPVGVQALAAAVSTPTSPNTDRDGFLDKHVSDRLRMLGIQSSAPCDDATFLRRVSLDLTGELPTPDEVRRFLSDTNPDRRGRKIEELLRRPGHATLWATKFCDLLKPVGFNANDKLVEPVEARRFFEWLRNRLEEGMAYDVLVERILTATSREGRPLQAWVEEVRQLSQEAADGSAPLKAYSQRKTLDLYWQKSRGAAEGGNATVKNGMLVAHAFLGLRLECAQCHRHPNDVWQQDDLLSFANFFSRVSTGTNNGSTPEARQDTKRLTEEAKKLRGESTKLSDMANKLKSSDKAEADRLTGEAKSLNVRAQVLEGTAGRLNSTEVHVLAKGLLASTSSPLGKQSATSYRLLGEPKPMEVAESEDPRAVVMSWLRRPDNPFFARAIVNRVWAHYFGRGIVDPPDHMSPLNPPTHSELLEDLSRGFLDNKYDLKWLHRTIVSSRTYQVSALPNASNRDDRRNFARFSLRRMSAEMAIDAINHATGGSEVYPKDARMPAGARVLELAGAIQPQNDQPKTLALSYALQLFGRPKRSLDVQCDCERENSPGIAQTLYLVNHPAVIEKLNAPQGRAARIASEHKTAEAQAEEAFLWVLGRMPTAEERTKAVNYVAGQSSPAAGVAGLLRTLMLTDEFLLNH